MQFMDKCSLLDLLVSYYHTSWPLILHELERTTKNWLQTTLRCWWCWLEHMYYLNYWFAFCDAIPNKSNADYNEIHAVRKCMCSDELLQANSEKWWQNVYTVTSWDSSNALLQADSEDVYDMCILAGTKCFITKYGNQCKFNHVLHIQQIHCIYSSKHTSWYLYLTVHM